MGKHVTTVSSSQLVILIKVSLAACDSRHILIIDLKGHLCWQHPLPIHHRHDEDFYPALLLPPLRNTGDSSRLQETFMHHSSYRRHVVYRLTHPRNLALSSNR